MQTNSNNDNIVLINDPVCNKINNNNTTNKSFKYKTKIIGSTPDNESRLNAEIAVPLKYLRNIWGNLDLALIHCEIKIDLRCERNIKNIYSSWSKCWSICVWISNRNKLEKHFK